MVKQTKPENESAVMAARVQQAYDWLGKAIEARNLFMLENADVFEEYQHLCEVVNERRKKLDIACRETQLGIGKISVSVVRTPVYRVDLLEEKVRGLEIDGRPIIEDLIQVKKSVCREVFDRLVADKVLTSDDVEEVIERVDSSVRLRGLPPEITNP